VCLKSKGECLSPKSESVYVYGCVSMALGECPCLLQGSVYVCMGECLCIWVSVYVAGVCVSMCVCVSV
jgi:hypothetical protein